MTTIKYNEGSFYVLSVIKIPKTGQNTFKFQNSEIGNFLKKMRQKMTYSSCMGGKFRPEAESASSSLSSCPDWPGLGLELREAIWRIFFVIFLFVFFRLHSKMGFWTSLDYIIGAVCFELRGLVHSLWKLTGCFKIGFYPMGGTYFGCFH